MNHSFNVEVATKYGIPHALVLGHIDFMVQKARTNGEKRIEGKYWMRKSVSEFAEMYPYLTKNQVRRAIEKLRDDGLIVSRRFKSNECTKTLWYTVTKEGRKLLGNDKTQTAPEPQRSGTSATPIRHESQSNTAQLPYGVAQEPTQTAPEPQRSGTDAIPSIKVLDSVVDTVLEGCNNSHRLQEDIDINPFGDVNDDDYRLNFDTIFTYASSNLRSLTGGNIERLQSFIDDLPEDLIRYAIDKACGLGHPFFGYVQPILQQYVEMGFKTVAEVEAYEAERKKRKGGTNGGDNRRDSSAAPQRIGGETIV